MSCKVDSAWNLRPVWDLSGLWRRHPVHCSRRIYLVGLHGGVSANHLRWPTDGRVQGLDDAIKVVDKDDRYGQRQRRRQRAQAAMDKVSADKARLHHPPAHSNSGKSRESSTEKV